MLEAAYKEYRSLQSQEIDPPGRFDRNGFWHLGEHFECCQDLPQPTRESPLVQVRHGRSLEHIAAKYELPEAYLAKNVTADIDT
jgi:hypothetical protein